MEVSRNWDDIVIKAILSFKDFKIKEVNEFESVVSLNFDKEKYPEIISLIKEKNWNVLTHFYNPKQTRFREFLEVVKFSDESRHVHIAMVYDSDELMQDPEIIEVIKLT